MIVTSFRIANLSLMLGGNDSESLYQQAIRKYELLHAEFPNTQDYLNEVTAFYVGLAALEVGDDVRADSTLEQATRLAEGEPAGWANWGVLALRQ